MVCGNNCAGCACKGEVIIPEERIEKLEEALTSISIFCNDPDWAKSDIGRFALDTLKG